MRSAIFGLRFLLELTLLVALGYWGFTAPDGVLLKLLLGLGAPIVAAVAWGLFVSPKAAVRLPASVVVGLELALFGAAAAALYVAGQQTLAVALAVAAVAQRAVLSALGEPAGVSEPR